MTNIAFNISFFQEYQKSLYYRKNPNLTPDSFLREKQAHSRIYANLVNSILKQMSSPLIEFTLMKNCSISQHFWSMDIESQVLEESQLHFSSRANDFLLPDTNYLMFATDLTNSISRFILSKKHGPQDSLLILSNYGHKDDSYFQAKVFEQMSFLEEVKQYFPRDEYETNTFLDRDGVRLVLSYVKSTAPKSSLTRTYYM